MKTILLILGLLCFIYALRNYYQYKEMKNILTLEIPWLPENKKYILHSMIIFTLVGIAFLYFSI